MRRLVVIGAVLLVVAAGCAQEADDTAPPDETGPQTRTVQVDANPEGFEGFALAYFPSNVTVRPGDTVEFVQDFTGEPHSVTLGTLVDETVGEFRQLTEDEEPSAELSEQFEELPVMLPEGPGDANQAAVNPCYVEEAPLPDAPDEPCEVSDLDDFEPFDGTQAFYSSGFLPADDGTFTVELSEDIETGSYVFYCNLHGPTMSGEIEVTDADREVPSADEVEEQRESEIEEAFESTEAAYEAASAGEVDFGNLAGFGAEGSESTGIMEFIPDEIEVEAGEEVTWTVFGPHTISFEPPVGYALEEADDGTWHLNEEALAPSGGEGQPPPPEEDPGDLGDEERPAEGEEAPPPEPTDIDGGTWDGEGFHSSGFVFSVPGPGSFFSYTMTFAEPGEYTAVCLIHPTMTGTVTVSSPGV